jgi:uncharacterized membrane protein YfcA
MELLGFALAAVIGLSLGLMGGGGSILTVPVLVYVLDFGAKPAIAMSLPLVGATSLFGAVGHWRAGNVHLRTALLFGVIAMAGSYFGARFAVFLSGAVQLLTLAVVMLAAAASMLRARPARVPSRDMEETKASGVPLPVGKILAVGLAVGVLTGIVGIGGGFLIVPALVVLGRVPMKQAVGTSLLVIAMNSASGFAGYFGAVDVPWGFLAAFTSVAIVGIVVGTYLVPFVSAAALKRGFAVFLLAVGALMLYQKRGAFTDVAPRDAAAGEHLQSSCTPPSLKRAVKRAGVRS